MSCLVRLCSSLRSLVQKKYIHLTVFLHYKSNHYMKLADTHKTTFYRSKLCLFQGHLITQGRFYSQLLRKNTFLGAFCLKCFLKFNCLSFSSKMLHYILYLKKTFLNYKKNKNRNLNWEMFSWPPHWSCSSSLICKWTWQHKTPTLT